MASSSRADDSAMHTDGDQDSGNRDATGPTKLFTLKKWNAVAMWSWDVECDTCAICRVQV
jgi:RING-box protein 2